jgi:hypothetical protein
MGAWGANAPPGAPAAVLRHGHRETKIDKDKIIFGGVAAGDRADRPDGRRRPVARTRRRDGGCGSDQMRRSSPKPDARRRPSTNELRGERNVQRPVGCRFMIDNPFSPLGR